MKHRPGMATNNSQQQQQQQALPSPVRQNPQAPKKLPNYSTKTTVAAIARRANGSTGDGGWRGASTELGAGLCPSRPAGDPFLGEQLPWLSCMQ